MISRAVFSFLLIIAFICGAFAQNTYSRVYEDFGSWNTVSVSHKFDKDWKIGGEFAIRFNDNASRLRSYHVQAELAKDFKYDFEFSTKLRYSIRPDKQVFRISGEVNKDVRIKPINIKYRLKLDWDKDVSTAEKESSTRWRNRIGLQYKKKKYKLSAHINVEWFHNYDNSLTLPNDIRLKTGIAYKVTKPISLGLDWMVQEERNTTNPERDYVIDFSIRYELGK